MVMRTERRIAPQNRKVLQNCRGTRAKRRPLAQSPASYQRLLPSLMQRISELLRSSLTVFWTALFALFWSIAIIVAKRMRLSLEVSFTPAA